MGRQLVLLVGTFLALAPEVAVAQPGPVPAGDRELLNVPLAEFERVSVSGRFAARTSVQNPEGESFRLYFDQITQVTIRLSLCG
jgi:hypothetical protein